MIAWAVDTLLATSLLMLLVLAVRRPVAEQFGAHWAYVLWLLPLLRFLMPPIDFFPDPLPVRQGIMIVVPAAQSALPLASSAGETGWLALLLALWLGGAAVFISWQQASYGAFMLSLGREGRRSAIGSYGGIPVVESEAVDGPAAVGFLRRRIVVPLDFARRYSPAEQRLALEHELVHHRRGDIWWNLAALIILTLNWFNPIAHFAFRAFRTDQELACDAAVARRNPDGRHDYALALVKSASWPTQIAVCPLNRADQLKERLKMLQRPRPGLLRSLAGSAATMALIGGGLVVAAPGFAREEAEKEPAQVFLAKPGKPSPIISQEEIATLRRKCRGGSTVVTADAESDRRRILCAGKPVHDPEVRAIVDRTLARAEALVDETLPKRLAAAEKAVAARRAEQAAAAARSRAAARAAEAERAADAAEKAAAARPRIVHLQHKRLKPLAVPRPVIRPIDHKAMARAMAEARAGLAVAQVELASLHIDRPDIDHAMRQAERARKHALRDAERERARAQREALREAQREAEEARREALQEAEEARREALLEAEQAKRDALREAQHEREAALREARLEREQALREAEQARREAQQALREAQRERETALREAEQARREAEKALREAEEQRRLALEQIRRAREEAATD